MIELRAVPGPTGRLLRELLTELNIRIGTPGQAIVSYGVPVRSGLPTLNAMAGRRTKLEELQALHNAGIPTPEVVMPGQVRSRATKTLLGRSLKHQKGRDIEVVPVGERPKKVHDYYTALVPKRREYRVWAFRRRCKATYEKRHRYRGHGRNHEVWNWRNGYAFEFSHNAPQEVKDLGCRAVDTLGLDFGAVDIIEGMDGRFYVLEVNTAPGVQDRRQGITALAESIARWVERGYPRRNGDEQG